jgi:hypothetical protein
VLIAHAAEAVVAIGGGAGTLSEMALTWELGGRPIVAVSHLGGQAAKQAGQAMDHRGGSGRHVIGARTPAAVVAALKEAGVLRQPSSGGSS